MQSKRAWSWQCIQGIRLRETDTRRGIDEVSNDWDGLWGWDASHYAMQNTMQGGLRAGASGTFARPPPINRSFQNVCQDRDCPLAVLKNVYNVYLTARRSWHIPHRWMEVSVDKATRGVWTGVWGERPRSLILPSFCLRACLRRT